MRLLRDSSGVRSVSALASRDGGSVISDDSESEDDCERIEVVSEEVLGLVE